MNLEEFKSIRQTIYNHFGCYADAAMDLIDALCSEGHRYKKPTQLSKSPAFRRKYSSITKAIHAYADSKQTCKLKDLFCKLHRHSKRHFFAIDTTPNPRPYAKTLSERVVTHYPNPAPGNKPICVGHPYSVIVALAQEQHIKDKHWVNPVVVERVDADEKGNLKGMRTLKQLIKDISQEGELYVSFADSLYGSHACRQEVIQNSDHVHVFRLRMSRNLFAQADTSNHKNGRKQEYGEKIVLSDPATHPDCDEQEIINFKTKKGKALTITLKIWRNLLLRGTREFRSSEHPINAIQATVTDESGHAVYKNPLWLGVIGKRKDELSMVDTYHGYCSRYDIEHFFRFGKNNLLIDQLQTPESAHEEAWWALCAIAYSQLYQAKELVERMPEPWQRYLAQYQDGDQLVITPSQTQQGFAKLLDIVGTPASTPIPRGVSQGRQKGQLQEKRTLKPITFKGNKRKKSIIPTSEKQAKKLEPQITEEVILKIQKLVKQFNIPPDKLKSILNKV